MKRVILFGALLLIVLTGVISCNSSKKASAGKPLEETSWQLTKAGDITYAPPAGVRKVYIKLSKDNKITGFLGCNNLIGSYKTGTGDQLSFMAASTRMFCQGDAMKYEDGLNKALTATRRYKIEGDKLSLMTDDGTWLADFKPM
ncbi:MAG: META domain-containing protein [Chitinophagaceae bacterium]